MLSAMFNKFMNHALLVTSQSFSTLQHFNEDDRSSYPFAEPAANFGTGFNINSLHTANLQSCQHVKKFIDPGAPSSLFLHF